MNGTAQRKHRTVTEQIAAHIETIAETTANRLDRLERAISDERTHRLKLADEQRAYVDSADRHARAHVDGEISTVFRNIEHAIGRIQECERFRARGFWARLNWLVRGR